MIGPGSRVAFLLYCDRLFAGWEIAAGGSRCEGAWAVGAPLCLEGCAPPDPAAGTITSCGVYTAPAARPPEPPTVAAIECPEFGCADACGASLTLDLAGYDAP